MPVVRYLHPDGTEAQVDGSVGESVMKAAVGAGVDGIVGECGGQLMCATCHVYVDDNFAHRLPAIGEDEDEMLGDTACPRTRQSRLSCQIALTDALAGLVVRLPDAQV